MQLTRFFWEVSKSYKQVYSNKFHMVVLQQIVLAALRAASPAGCIKLQAMAHSAHPANLNTWISNNQGVWFNTLCHNRARTNECILTNVMTTDNSGICANSCRIVCDADCASPER